VSAGVFELVQPPDPHDDPRLWVGLFAFVWPILLNPLFFVIVVIWLAVEKNQRLTYRLVTLTIAAGALVTPFIPAVVVAKPWLRTGSDSGSNPGPRRSGNRRAVGSGSGSTEPRT